MLKFLFVLIAITSIFGVSVAQHGGEHHVEPHHGPPLPPHGVPPHHGPPGPPPPHHGAPPPPHHGPPPPPHHGPPPPPAHHGPHGHHF